MTLANSHPPEDLAAVLPALPEQPQGRRPRRFKVAMRATKPLPVGGPLEKRAGVIESPEDRVKRALAGAIERAAPAKLSEVITSVTTSIVAINASTTRTTTVKWGLTISAIIIVLGLATAVFTDVELAVLLPVFGGAFAVCWGCIAIGAGSAAMTRALLEFFARRPSGATNQLRGGPE